LLDGVAYRALHARGWIIMGSPSGTAETGSATAKRNFYGGHYRPYISGVRFQAANPAEISEPRKPAPAFDDDESVSRRNVLDVLAAGGLNRNRMFLR